MVVERMTALKVRIADLTSGKWVKREGLDPSYIVTKSGEQVSRARILATIVGKFVAEDENFASVTLDDSTDTIRAKTFKTVKPLDAVDVGNVVDVVGKVREYNEEIYIIPEIVQVVTNANIEILRELELIRKAEEMKKSGKKPAPASPEEDPNELRKEILKMIVSEDDGLDYSKLVGKIKASEGKVESVVNELLSEGICYEPTPGRIKKI